NGEIGFGDPPSLESLLESPVHLGIARQQQASARVTVQPVDGGGQAQESKTKMVKIIFQTLPRPAAGMNGKARRLIAPQGLSIEEQDAVFPHIGSDFGCLSLLLQWGNDVNLVQPSSSFNDKLTF